MGRFLSEIESESTWNDFREYKSHHGHMSNRDMAVLDKFINDKGYLSVTGKIKEALPSGGTGLSLPEKRILNKSGTRKKRTVYCFGEAETWVLKLVAFMLYRYDSKISDACYSFRVDYTSKKAISAIRKIRNLDGKYVLKIDIHNYFNSIPPEKLSKVLSDVVDDDEELFLFLDCIISVGKARWGEEVISERMGAMAGVPLSAFFADIYLSDMDEAFISKGIPYFRYSDDIIIFADSKAERDEAMEFIKEFLQEKGLELNLDKTAVSDPGEPWEFLGFKYVNGEIDLSDVTVKKIKDKIRRKAKALYRWRCRKNMDFEHTAKVMTRVFNRKFYDFEGDNEFTWSRWFFPCITVTGGLHEIDEYMLEYIRYLYSGRHYKGNYRISYDDIKELGYHSLVHEYYKGEQT